MLHLLYMSEVQNKLLELLKAFNVICEEHDLRYFAYAGTAIGAVRHNGFIPWDDDIDVLMPLPDYNKLLAIFNSKRESSVYKTIDLVDGMKSETAVYNIARIIDRTSMFTDNDHLFQPNDFTGIYIDIFPLVGMPHKTEHQEEYMKDLHRVLEKLRTKKLYSIGSETLDSLNQQYYSIINKYEFDKSTMTCPADRVQMANKYISYPSSGFISYNRVKFEDCTIRVPIGYHEQLTKKFGNYMKLPPKSMRTSHHANFALVDTNNPYTSYKKLFEGSGITATYINYVSNVVIKLQNEKFDLLSRIPPLEARIKLELLRVDSEVAEKKLLANPSVKMAARLLIAACKRSIRQRLRLD